MVFSDYRSEDHAALGVKVIQANRVLHGLEPALAGIIVRMVGYHNRADLSVGEDGRCLFFLKLLRDPDKVDIWRVVTDYYQNAGHDRNQTIELDLPDRPQISDAVYKIDARYYGGPGVGYRIIDGPKNLLVTEAVFNYVKEKYIHNSDNYNMNAETAIIAALNS